MYVAAMLLLLAGVSSCKKGKCACIGTTDGVKTDIMDERQETGYSDSEVCDRIRDAHPKKQEMVCGPGKSLEDMRKN